ncbi:hypothetical protein Krac_7997 [Ktedonobacter racemifer DSM 44963]|uniref:Uncharacterized protein n=1 Tax=Ktedonobacter racemifer DSM 44963 TaxID=485913 RepID=D6TLN6_KTERA|nr:hypothetical protein Krac_7997 [Ktedonobacter racemifer DSM 44963]
MKNSLVWLHEDKIVVLSALLYNNIWVGGMADAASHRLAASAIPPTQASAVGGSSHAKEVKKRGRRPPPEWSLSLFSESEGAG